MRVSKSEDSGWLCAGCGAALATRYALGGTCAEPGCEASLCRSCARFPGFCRDHDPWGDGPAADRRREAKAKASRAAAAAAEFETASLANLDWISSTGHPARWLTRALPRPGMVRTDLSAVFRSSAGDDGGTDADRIPDQRLVADLENGTRLNLVRTGRGGKRAIILAGAVTHVVTERGVPMPGRAAATAISRILEEHAGAPARSPARNVPCLVCVGSTGGWIEPAILSLPAPACWRLYEYRAGEATWQSCAAGGEAACEDWAVSILDCLAPPMWADRLQRFREWAERLTGQGEVAHEKRAARDLGENPGVVRKLIDESVRRGGYTRYDLPDGLVAIRPRGPVRTVSRQAAGGAA